MENWKTWVFSFHFAANEGTTAKKLSKELSVSTF